MNNIDKRYSFQTILTIVASILVAGVQGQTHAPPCGLVAFEPENWAEQPLSDSSYNFTFDVFEGNEGECRIESPGETTTFNLMLASKSEDLDWTFQDAQAFGPRFGSTGEAVGNAIRRYHGAFSVQDDDLRDTLRTLVRDDDIQVSAYLSIGGWDVYVYNDVYKGDLTHTDLRDLRPDLLTYLQRQPATSTWPEFAEFLFSGTRFLFESEGEIRKTYQSPPSWSDIDQDAPYCTLSGSIYSSCIAKNNVLTVSDSDGMTTSYTLSVFRDQSNDTAIRLFSRTYHTESAEIGEYGVENTITTNIDCDDTIVALTDEPNRHRHLPTHGLAQACRWVSDNVDRNVYNTFVAW